MHDKSKQYIQKVEIAPQPVVYLMNDLLLDNFTKCCTDNTFFTIFQADPTFNLGDFSLLSTEYENLFLISRESNAHPLMVGPIMIHQKKDLQTYQTFFEFILNMRPNLINLKASGTDGEEALSSALQKVFFNATPLLCFLHFKRNIIEHMKKIGIDEYSRKKVIPDLFGEQIGSCFEEGIVDSEDVLEFEQRLLSVRDVWVKRMGEKGEAFFSWFMQYKMQNMCEKMIKPV